MNQAKMDALKRARLQVDSLSLEQSRGLLHLFCMDTWPKDYAKPKDQKAVKRTQYIILNEIDIVSRGT